MNHTYSIHVITTTKDRYLVEAPSLEEAKKSALKMHAAGTVPSETKTDAVCQQFWPGERHFQQKRIKV